MRIHFIIRIFFFILLSLIFLSCSGNPVENFINRNSLLDNSDKVTIHQGVWGNVWFWEGDFMPGIINSCDGKITPVVRDIYVYQATRYDSVEIDSVRRVFVRNIHSRLVARIKSDNEGFFQIALPVGKYSFFVKEDSLFFANEVDGEGYLMSAKVTRNKVTKRQIDINYKAAF